jgi:hypothetical protein
MFVLRAMTAEALLGVAQLAMMINMKSQNKVMSA